MVRAEDEVDMRLIVLMFFREPEGSGVVVMAPAPNRAGDSASVAGPVAPGVEGLVQGQCEHRAVATSSPPSTRACL